ncbi:MAG: hypothetical protein OXB86_07175, partial [Bdellovibrionales bacterium]|nr:hypothetical protein [Bdellovibrionales bacterium]
TTSGINVGGSAGINAGINIGGSQDRWQCTRGAGSPGGAGVCWIPGGSTTPGAPTHTPISTPGGSSGGSDQPIQWR